MKLTEAQKLRAARAEARKLRVHLTDLTQAVMSAIAWIDDYAQTEKDRERGKALAKTVNVIEVANDTARYGGLGIAFRTDKKRPKALEQLPAAPARNGGGDV